MSTFKISDLASRNAVSPFSLSNKDSKILQELSARTFDFGAIVRGEPDSWVRQVSNRFAQENNWQGMLNEFTTIAPFAALAPSTRDLSVQGGDTGADLVMTEVSPDRITAPLRNTSVLLRAGATVLHVTDGSSLLIPRMSSPGVASSGELTTASVAGSINFEQTKLVGDFYKTSVVVSNQLIRQSKYNPGILNYLKTQLTKNAALLLDQMALNATGVTGQDNLGIFNVANNTLPSIDPAKTSQSITAAGSWTWANTMTAAGNLDLANIDANRTWLISPATATKLRQAFKTGTTFPSYILQDGLMGDYPALVSNQLALNGDKGILIDGSQAIFALFGGGAFIEVNPYLYATQFSTQISVGIWGAFGMTNYSAACPTTNSMAL
jgi:HK97 family phage major capsid protein